MRRIPKLLTLLGCLLSPATAFADVPLHPVAVFGADDRVALPPRFGREQNAIGLLIDARSRSVCTAFCVADTVIATAGHCLFKTAGERKPRLADFWFARNYDQMRDLTRIGGHDRNAAAQHVLAGSMALKVSPPIDASSDWALVKLARQACPQTLELRPTPVEAAIQDASAGRVFQIAYHRDFTLWRQAYSMPCAISRSFPGATWDTIAADFRTPNAILLHTCDTGGASSGSPLLVETATGPRVIGINIGTYVQSRVVIGAGAAVAPAKAEPVANTAVIVSGLPERVLALQVASIVTPPARLREMQQRLKQLEFYSGAIDGSYGSGLQGAIEAYEMANGLPVTGVASEAIRDRLKNTR